MVKCFSAYFRQKNWKMLTRRPTGPQLSGGKNSQRRSKAEKGIRPRPAVVLKALRQDGSPSGQLDELGKAAAWPAASQRGFARRGCCRSAIPLMLRRSAIAGLNAARTKGL